MWTAHDVTHFTIHARFSSFSFYENTRNIKNCNTNYIINTHTKILPALFPFGWAPQAHPPSLAPPLARSVTYGCAQSIYSNRCPELQRYSHRSPGDCIPPIITTTTSSSPLHPYHHLPTILILTLVQVNISILTARLWISPRCMRWFLFDDSSERERARVSWRCSLSASFSGAFFLILLLLTRRVQMFLFSVAFMCSTRGENDICRGLNAVE